MKNTHENLLGRVNNTLDFYKLYKEKIDVVKVLQTGFEKLRVLATKIKDSRAEGEMGLSKFVELRDEMKEKSAKIAVACAKPLYSFADANSLVDIKAVVKTAPTAYKKGRANLIISRLKVLRKHYSEQLPNMTDYNTSPFMLQTLDDLIVEISKNITLPIDKRSHIKLTNNQIKAAAKEIYILYEKTLESNMEPFVITDPGLYAAWVEANRIIHTAATHLSPEEAAAKRILVEQKAAEKATAKAAKAQAAKDARAAKAVVKAASKAALAAAKAATKAAKSKSKAVKAVAPKDSTPIVSDEVPTTATTENDTPTVVAETAVPKE